MTVTPNMFQCCLHHVQLTQVHGFSEMDYMQAKNPRKCKRCVSCPQCQVMKTGRTIKEQYELDLMAEGVEHDAEGKFVRVKYPIVGDVTKFKDNRHQAELVANSLHKRLTKNGQLEV